MAGQRKESKAMDKEILISVIIPTYNRGYVISRAIDSVLKQSFSNWELIIVDDGSNDNTQEVVNGYKDVRIKYIKNKVRKGACYSRNIGMKNACGAYFCFLDSDCTWKKEFLLKRINAAKEYDADLIYGRMKHIDGDKVTEWPYDLTKDLNDINYVVKTLIYRNLIDTNTVMLKRICWTVEGGFDEKLLRLQDWEYFSRILHTEKYKLHFQDNNLVLNYQQNDSISVLNKWGVWRIKIFEKHIEFCRRKNILTEVASELYLNQGDFEGNDDYRQELCSLLTKNELCSLVYNMGNRVETQNDVIANMDRIIKKNVSMVQVTGKCLPIEQARDRINKYLSNRDVKSIAIYGFGVLGKLFYECIKDSPIRIECIIDRNKNNIEKYFACKLISDIEIEDAQLYVDLVIVTAIADYEEIKAVICKKMDEKKIASLEDIL